MDKYRVASFYSCNCSERLQQRINEFLEKNDGKIEVIEIKQSASGRIDHHVTITILYKLLQ